MLYILIQYDNIEYVFQSQNTWNVSFELFLIAFPFNIIEVKYRKTVYLFSRDSFRLFFLSFFFIFPNKHLPIKKKKHLEFIFCVARTFKKL